MGIVVFSYQNGRLFSLFVHLMRPPDGLIKDKFYLSFCGGFAECGNRKALRLKAQGVYSCK